MNNELDHLQPYPFERLRQLKEGRVPPGDKPHIALSIGEPKHTPPAIAADALTRHLYGMASYPLTAGTDALRQSIGQWLSQRFSLPASAIDAGRHVLPVNGTREALFAFAQAVVNRAGSSSQAPLVVMPNPFYQIYEGACLLAGAEPFFLNTTADNSFVPDLDAVPDAVWQRCQLIYLCTPGNPTGAVMNIAYLQQLIELAERFDFVIASDECYSEIYFDEAAPPAGLLQAAQQMGHDDFKRCVVFHSLSKRSNVPGLRSGFVAGDADILAKFLLYRTYHGCAMPPFVQHASIALWNDEEHVKANRELYRSKFDKVLEILSPVMNVTRPDAAFYLWPETPIDDESFARDLFAQQNVTVLPGKYLSREAAGTNPGNRRVRIALVANEQECIEAAQRIRRFIEAI